MICLVCAERRAVHVAKGAPVAPALCDVCLLDAPLGQHFCCREFEVMVNDLIAQFEERYEHGVRYWLHGPLDLVTRHALTPEVMWLRREFVEDGAA